MKRMIEEATETMWRRSWDWLPIKQKKREEEMMEGRDEEEERKKKKTK